MEQDINAKKHTDAEQNSDAGKKEPVEAKTEKEATALKACEASLQEMKDNYLRVSADFQNFKRRLEKERVALKRMMQADILRDILAIVDNFDRALQENEHAEKPAKAWREGFKLIQKDLYKLLQKYGVKELESYDEFNPELHEAVMQVQSDTHKPGSIVEVLQKGYLLDDQILRPAKVSIAQ